MVVSVASTELSDASWRPVCQGLFLFWNVFGAYVLGQALGLYSEMYQGVMLRDVSTAHVLERVRDSCDGTLSGLTLWDV